MKENVKHLKVFEPHAFMHDLISLLKSLDKLPQSIHSANIIVNDARGAQPPRFCRA